MNSGRQETELKFSCEDITEGCNLYNLPLIDIIAESPRKHIKGQNEIVVRHRLRMDAAGVLITRACDRGV